MPLNEKELKEMKEFAEKQMNEALETPVGFAFEDIWVINPWTETTGRFDVDPIEFYGQANFDLFVSRFKAYELVYNK